MKVAVDYSRCAGLGICESFASEIFEIDESGALLVRRAEIPQQIGAAVRAAVAGCPTEALRLEDD
ncbi:MULTISPECIES: ferredoxin [Nocardia]|uniref:ferredoxin n=1 Tax=Nocardia TaxID=1817 RepID=UPI000D688E8C|nr:MULTISPECIES: ferredoxin [Nocardia]